MPDKEVHLLSTRPLDAPLIQQAAAANITIDMVSFIQTTPLRAAALQKEINQLSRQPLTVVFTSMNAAEAVAGCLEGSHPQWKVFSLGTATAKVVHRSFGIKAFGETAGDASALADEIIKQRVRDVIFFCGDHRRDELPHKLASHNIGVKEIVVYATSHTPKKIAKAYDGILFFSPSAVESFFTVNNVPPDTILFAIGATTAAAISQQSSNTIVSSDLPGKINLVEKAVAFFKHIKHTNEHIEE